MSKLGERNKKQIYFGIYMSEAEIIDEYGNFTGQYKVLHSAPIPMRANVSPAKGAASVEMFGTDEGYSKTIVTDDMNCLIDEQSILWVDRMPQFNEEGFNIIPHDYVVVRVARSLNSIAYAIKKVDVK